MRIHAQVICTNHQIMIAGCTLLSLNLVGSSDVFSLMPSPPYLLFLQCNVKSLETINNAALTTTSVASASLKGCKHPELKPTLIENAFLHVGTAFGFRYILLCQ